MDYFLFKKKYEQRIWKKKMCGQEQGQVDMPGLLTEEAMAKLLGL